MNRTKPKTETYFSTDHLVADLKGRSVRGGLVTFSSQAGKIVLTLAATCVLARKLSPADFGLLGMVTAITSFIIVFKDMGLSMATLQRPEINHAQVSTLFWINIAIGTLMMLVTAATGPLIAWFYQEPRLVSITTVLAVSFFFAGLTVQHQAILRRQMRFGALAAIELSSRLVGSIVAITLALMGLKYWALVCMLVTFEVITTAGCWIICRWRPGRPRRRAGVRSLLAFGGNVTGFNLLNYLYRNLDKILIGKVVGSSQLGFYAKAGELIVAPTQSLVAPITAVVIPALSRLQNDLLAFKRYYLRAVYLLSVITMPVMIFLLFYAPEVIHLILGDQWTSAVPIFRLFCLAAVYQPVAASSSWLFISRNRTSAMFRWRLLTVWLSVFLFIVGVFIDGAHGVACGYAASGIILTVPTIWYARKETGIETINVFRATGRPLLAAILAAAVSRLIFDQVCHNFFLPLFLMPLLYLVFTCLLACGPAPIQELVHLLRRHVLLRGKTISTDYAD